MTKVLALLALPLVLAPIEAARFYSANRDSGRVISSGRVREYSLHVPPGYRRGTPVPLVISMPGAGLWGAAQERVSGWDALADREGFIVVYPTGAKGSGPRHFHVEPGPALDEDVAYVRDLIDAVTSTYTIDPARIYANGLSNGGGMAFVLSCTMSNRIAAVGMASAAYTLPWTWCANTRPVPMIAFHGTEDRGVPYGGGTSWVAPDPFPNIPMWTANWARRNRCAPAPIDSPIAPNVTRRAYTGCANDADVELYTIRGGGHEWPGGGPLPEWLCGPFTHSIYATREMWTFFSRHRLR